MAFRWRAEVGLFIVVFGFSLTYQLKKVVKVGPPLTKLSGSTHVDGILSRFLAVPWVDLQFVIVAFPSHTFFWYISDLYLSLKRQRVLSMSHY